MSTATETDIAAALAASQANRVGFSDPVYGDVMDFLTLEAALLDADRHLEWLTMVAEDVVYSVPGRTTMYLTDGTGVLTDSGSVTYAGLKMQVDRNVVSLYAYDRNPPPRTRRLVSNVCVYRTETECEYRVESYVVFLRNEADRINYDMLTGLRKDVLRKTDAGWRLARREVVIDVSTLAASFTALIL